MSDAVWWRVSEDRVKFTVDFISAEKFFTVDLLPGLLIFGVEGEDRNDVADQLMHDGCLVVS